MDKNRKIELKLLEKKLGIKMKELCLLDRALTHTSYAHEKLRNEEHYEKLEFLGDGVLSLVIEEYLILNYNYFSVGKLVKIKSYVVREETLFKVALNLGLNNYLLLGHGEEITGGRKKSSILADALEAVYGAYFLDAGFEKTKKFVLKHFKSIIESKIKDTDFRDSKTKLQEIVQQKYKINPVYKLLKESGPDHDKLFKVGVYVAGELWGEGIGKNKKIAEKIAAKNALKKLQKE